MTKLKTEFAFGNFPLCILFIFSALCVGILGNVYSAYAAKSRADQVCFSRKCVNVEIVREREEIRRGLQFRNSLGVDNGMLFIFSKSWPYAFWMKDTLIPLDMVWMDYGRRIIHIEHNVPPCKEDPCPRYEPGHPALYVLEINAGYAKKLGLKIGDTAQFKLRETEKN